MFEVDCLLSNGLRIPEAFGRFLFLLRQPSPWVDIPDCWKVPRCVSLPPVTLCCKAAGAGWRILSRCGGQARSPARRVLLHLFASPKHPRGEDKLVKASAPLTREPSPGELEEGLLCPPSQRETWRDVQGVTAHSEKALSESTLCPEVWERFHCPLSEMSLLKQLNLQSGPEGGHDRGLRLYTVLVRFFIFFIIMLTFIMI